MLDTIAYLLLVLLVLLLLTVLFHLFFCLCAAVKWLPAKHA
jgi:hypothetical protein